MLQRGQQRHRRQRAAGQIEHQAQKRAGRGAVQRQAGGIVDVDVPAAQLGGDPAGELAVRRDQRRGRARGFELAAQQQRDRHRLVLRAGAVVARDPGERVRRRAAAGRARHRWRRPAAAPRRQQAQPRAAAARVRRGGSGRCGQSRHIGRPRARERAAAAPFRCCGCVGSSAISSHSSGSQPRSSPGRITAPGRARRSPTSSSVSAGMPPVRPAAITGAGGGMSAPQRRLAPQQPVAPLGRVERAFGLEDRRPLPRQDVEKAQHHLPVLGQFRRRQVAQSVEAGALGRRLVEQPGERRRQRGGLSRQQRLVAARRAPARAPAGSAAGGGATRGSPAGCPGSDRRPLGAAERDLVVVEIADRPQPRQQQRRAGSLPSPSGAETPRAAPAPRAGSAAARSSAAAAADRRRPARAARRAKVARNGRSGAIV